MIPASLIASLGAFDEAALSLLANKGVVRRAQRDVEEGKIAIASFDGKSVIVLADGETVKLDERGARTASCTCPAPGICRHRIGAVLWVQSQEAPIAEGAQVAAAPRGPPPPSLQDEVSAITPEVLAKWAGKASWRGALALADEPGAVIEQEGTTLQVTFGADGPTVRILQGQGLDGMASKASAATKKAYHAAAIIVARRHFGIIDNETVAEPIETATDIAPQTIDQDFLVSVSDALREAANVALNIAPMSLQERLFTLSVSSRADALPRLGAMLRGLSKQVGSKRARDFSFEPDGCLELLSECFALITALKRAGPSIDPKRLDHLKGRTRQEFTPIADISLSGCGADQWVTEGGARGITAHFYDQIADDWYSASVARASGQDPSFDPLAAYSNEAIWSGLTLKKVAASSISLRDASAAKSGRLSAGQNVRASLALDQALPVVSNWACNFTDWEAMAGRLETRLTGGLSAPIRGAEPIIVSPHRVARPQFHDLSQTLSWAIEDNSGRWLSLTLEHGRDRGGVFDALEKIAESDWTGSIVVLASIDGHKFHLRPFALIGSTGIVSLGLDKIPEPTKLGFAVFASRLITDIRAKLSGLPRHFVALPKSTTQGILDASWQRLVEMAEIGIDLPRSQVATDLSAHAQRLDDSGFPSLGAMVKRICAEDKTSCDAYFQACYAVRLAQRQLIALPLLRPVG